jgi:GNAT superfamily N-acetyltransferase
MVGSPTLQTYYLVSPSNIDSSNISSDTFASMANTIRSFGLSEVNSAFGMKPLVDGFLESWSKGFEPALRIRAEPYLASRLAFLSMPKYEEVSKKWAGSNRPSSLRVVDIATVERSEEGTARLSSELVECIKSFWGSHSDESTETAVRMVSGTMERKERGRLWACLTTAGMGDSDATATVAGYLYTGRETSKTIAIRNVFTHGNYRGRGVAKSLVQMACHWWLLLQTEAQKRKDYVTLYVEPANTAATNLYVKCGFEIDAQPWERRGFEEIGMGGF